MIFSEGSVPVSVAAKIYGKDPAWVRAGIVSGWLPVGVATRNGKLVTDVKDLDSRYGRTNFYISPKKLYEHTGYIWKEGIAVDAENKDRPPDISRLLDMFGQVASLVGLEIVGDITFKDKRTGEVWK